MITTINIRISSGHVNMPLPMSAVIEGSSATVVVDGVPSRKSGIAINGCIVSVTNPAGQTTSVSATAMGGQYVATIPASHFGAAGNVREGVMIECVGKDEQNADRSWRLGIGDLVVIPSDANPTSLGTLQGVNYRTSVPANPVVGDLAKHGSTWKIYNGTAWDALGGSGGAPDWEDVQNKPLGLPNGVATLGSDAKLTAEQMPDIPQPPTPVPIDPAEADDDGQFADALATKTLLAGKVDTETGKTLIASVLVSWLSAFKGTDAATTLASLVSQIGGKVDKEAGKGLVELTNASGYNDIASMSAYALEAENASRIVDASIPGNQVGFYEGRAVLLNLDSILGTFAYLDELPYAKSSTVGTRKVLTLTATTAQSVTLPTIQDTDEILNCDIWVNADGASADVGMTINSANPSTVPVRFPNGEAITCKKGCVTMITCVGVNGQGWCVAACNTFSVPAPTVGT